MSKGIVFFAKNKEGYKLSFTKKKCVSDAIDNLNVSQVLHNFEFECGVYISKPKSVKDNLKKDISEYCLDNNKELYKFDDNILPYKLLYSYSANGIMLKNKYDKPYLDDSDNESDYGSDSELDNESESESDSEEFEVEKIVRHEGNIKNLKNMRFLVKWKGYDSDEDTLEPIKNLIDNTQFRKYVNDNKKELKKLKEMIDLL